MRDTPETTRVAGLRNCLTGVRAENYPFGAPELVELELYLFSRAAGMADETPAVRP